MGIFNRIKEAFGQQPTSLDAKSDKYYQEVLEIIQELSTLLQDENVQEELYMHHLTGMPVSPVSGVFAVHDLGRRLSNLTGKTQKELFDNNFKGVQKILDDMVRKGIVSG